MGRLLLGCDRRPGIAEQRAEAKVVFVALHLNRRHMNGVRHSAEGRHGIGAHDLRGDEEVDAIYQSAGQQGCIQPRAGFSEQGEDAFLA